MGTNIIQLCFSALGVTVTTIIIVVAVTELRKYVKSSNKKRK